MWWWELEGGVHMPEPNETGSHGGEAARSEGGVGPELLMEVRIGGAGGAGWGGGEQVWPCVYAGFGIAWKHCGCMLWSTTSVGRRSVPHTQFN